MDGVYAVVLRVTLSRGAALPPRSRCAEPLGARLCPLDTEEGFGGSDKAGMVADVRYRGRSINKGAYIGHHTENWSREVSDWCNGVDKQGLDRLVRVEVRHRDFKPEP